MFPGEFDSHRTVTVASCVISTLGQRASPIRRASDSYTGFMGLRSRPPQALRQRTPGSGGAIMDGVVEDGVGGLGLCNASLAPPTKHLHVARLSDWTLDSLNGLAPVAGQRLVSRGQCNCDLSSHRFRPLRPHRPKA